MARTPSDIASHARSHGKTAIKVLQGIMNNPDLPASARSKAAEVLLERGYGKAKQVVEGKVDHKVIVEVVE